MTRAGVSAYLKSYAKLIIFTYRSNTVKKTEVTSMELLIFWLFGIPFMLFSAMVIHDILSPRH